MVSGYEEEDAGDRKAVPSSCTTAIISIAHSMARVDDRERGVVARTMYHAVDARDW